MTSLLIENNQLVTDDQETLVELPTTPKYQETLGAEFPTTPNYQEPFVEFPTTPRDQETLGTEIPTTPTHQEPLAELPTFPMYQKSEHYDILEKLLHFAVALAVQYNEVGSRKPVVKRSRTKAGPKKLVVKRSRTK